MSTSRREFIQRSAILGGSVAAASIGLSRMPAFGAGVFAPEKKRILILGGTGFIGPKTVEAALARGHQVTIFNRGKREKYLPFEFDVEHLYGNRDPELPADDEKGPDGKLLRPDSKPKGLEQLVGKSFDAVIDNSGYYPRMVKASAELLSKNAKQYVFISSISAYDGSPAAGGDEDSKLAELSDPTVETMGENFQHYGGLKVLCESAAEAAFPGKTTIVRPGYIVGPGDPTDRFTYWPVRISKGGDVLAPGSAADPIQYVDVRDLAEWLVKLVEDGTTGSFNAITKTMRWGDVLQTCVDVSKSGAKLAWVPTAWLAENGLGGEDSFPIWAPDAGETAGFHRWSHERSVKAGLKSRPVADTVEGILAWFPTEVERRVRVTKQLQEEDAAAGKEPRKLPDPKLLKAGPSEKREAELLAEWKESSGG
jgi:2'-hydroxyisoflavone reductase